MSISRRSLAEEKGKTMKRKPEDEMPSEEIEMWIKMSKKIFKKAKEIVASTFDPSVAAIKSIDANAKMPWMCDASYSAGITSRSSKCTCTFPFTWLDMSKKRYVAEFKKMLKETQLRRNSL